MDITFEFKIELVRSIHGHVSELFISEQLSLNQHFYYYNNNSSAAAAAKLLQSCPTLRSHRQQPTRLRHPWDSPGKNTGVGCHFLLQCMKVKSECEVTQSCPTLFASPWTEAYQAPPSMGFSRQEYWSGLPLPSTILLEEYEYCYWFEYYPFMLSGILLPTQD